MLRITRQTDYGVILLSRLAGEAEGKIHTARDLSEEFKLPLPMVGKILKLLAKKGLLHSHRGAKGGYTLAKKPSEITVLEVISILEGPIAVTECSHDATANGCLQQPFCNVTDNWQIINRAVRSALAKITLADMSHPLPRRGEGAALPANFVSVESLTRRIP